MPDACVDHQPADRRDRVGGRRGDQVDRHDGLHLLAFDIAAGRRDGHDVAFGDDPDRPDRALHQEHADLFRGQLLRPVAERVMLLDAGRPVAHDQADRLLGGSQIQDVAHGAPLGVIARPPARWGLLQAGPW